MRKRRREPEVAATGRAFALPQRGETAPRALQVDGIRGALFCRKRILFCSIFRIRRGADSSCQPPGGPYVRARCRGTARWASRGWAGPGEPCRPSPLPLRFLPCSLPSLPLRSAGRGARRRGARRSGALPLRGEAGRPEMADARGVRGERSGARGSPWPFRCVARGGKGRRGSVCGLPAGRRRVCGARLRSPRADSGHGAASLPRGLCRTSHRLFQFVRCFHVLLLVKLVGLLEAEDGESGADQESGRCPVAFTWGAVSVLVRGCCHAVCPSP